MLITNLPALINAFIAAPTFITSCFRRFCGFILIALLCIATAHAQDTTIPNRGLYPTGAYASSNIDTINTTNGDLMLRIPLASLPSGRGGNPGFSVNLLYDGKLFDSSVLRHVDTVNGINYDLNTLKLSNNGGWRLGMRYQMTVVRRSDSFDNTSQPSCPSQNAVYIWKLKMSFPDGSVHEFRPTGYSDVNGLGDGYYNINYDGWQNACPTGSYVVTTGMTYYSTDGTYARLFVQHDGDGNMYNNPWTLYFPDGRRVSDNGNGTQTIYDRNNNYVTIQGTTLGNGHLATLITDQLGRTITDEQDPAGYDYVYTTGYNGQQVKWTIKWKNVYIYQQYITNPDAPTPPGRYKQINTAILAVDLWDRFNRRHADTAVRPRHV